MFTKPAFRISDYALRKGKGAAAETVRSGLLHRKLKRFFAADRRIFLIRDVPTVALAQPRGWCKMHSSYLLWLKLKRASRVVSRHQQRFEKHSRFVKSAKIVEIWQTAILTRRVEQQKVNYMKILIDINHPAHVHFFRNPIGLLKERGHDLMITSRNKEVAVPLLDELNIVHAVLSSQNSGGGLFALGRELVQRDAALYKVARAFKPNAMAAIGGTFVAHVGWLTGIPSLVFYDTENAKLQNAITYPVASKVIVPRCYQSWTPKHSVRYAGYHELSYLHPDRFSPDSDIAERNGLDPNCDNFFIRTVSWQANHDVGESGWNEKLLVMVTEHLSRLGKVHISSEAVLPDSLRKYAYRGKVSDVHHLMAHCRMFIGESATMASECAVLGVPAIYAANTGRGYTDEQEQRYALVANIRQLSWARLREQIEWWLAVPKHEWRARRRKLLDETIDVAAFVVETIEHFATAKS